MNVRKWARRLIARAVCLVMIGVVCVPVIGCARSKTTKGEHELPEKAKAKSAQMREEGMEGKRAAPGR